LRRECYIKPRVIPRLRGLSRGCAGYPVVARVIPRLGVKGLTEQNWCRAANQLKHSVHYSTITQAVHPADCGWNAMEAEVGMTGSFLASHTSDIHALLSQTACQPTHLSHSAKQRVLHSDRDPVKSVLGQQHCSNNPFTFPLYR